MSTTRLTSLEHAQSDQALIADFEDELSTSGMMTSDSLQSQMSKAKYKPHWASWNERPVATVREAVCLVHGVNPPAYSRLDDEDSRRIHFGPHLKTLKQMITYVGGVRIAPGEDYECEPGDGTRIVLRDFVDQVRAGRLFKGFVFPEEFVGLNPPLPFEFEERASASSLSSEAALTPQQEEGTNERPSKSWARLLVLMAIEHYGFIPEWPPEKLSEPMKVSGLYQPLATLSEKHGVPYLRDRGTVRDAFLAAVQRLGEEEVKKIRAKLEENVKSAQSSPAAHT